MANKAISELPQAQNVNNQDLFVLEQSGIAKKLPAETFITEQGIIDALASALDGHGGIQSVTLSSVSGRIRTYRITFTDQSATTFQVYDGTSIDRISRTSSSGLDDVYTIFLSDGTTTFFTVHNGADGTVSEAMLNDALKDKAPVITETTESSAIANFTDGADDLVMHNIVAEINPVQDLSNGDPSPSNICPITGWTGCNVTRTGKNLLDPLYRQNLSNNVRFYYGTGFLVKANETYTFSISQPSAQNQIALVSDNSKIAVNYGKASITFTPTEDSLVFLDSFYNSGMPAPEGGTSAVVCQLELGSTATAYEPYQGETVTVDWTTEAGTVYGGTIDVATGLLTVDRAIVEFDGSDDESWSLQSVNSYNIANFSISHTHYSGTANYLTLCNYLTAQTSAIAATQTNGFLVHQNGSTIYIRLSTSYASTVTELRTWLANNPLQIVYGLTTSQTYQLTPQEVKTLLGTDNVWADTGNVSVTYPADTKMYIEKLTIPSEDDLVANQAITSGKYFMIGNSLYLALANIASGAQITIGTNAQRVSLADALNTINS